MAEAEGVGDFLQVELRVCAEIAFTCITWGSEAVVPTNRKIAPPELFITIILSEDGNSLNARAEMS